MNDVLRETTAPVVKVNNETYQAIPMGTIGIWDHMFLRELDLTRLMDMATGRGQQLRIIFFQRDPRELILSGYFYHQTTTEWWCHVPMEVVPMFPKMAALCRDDNVAACVVQDYLRRNASYQAMLNNVSADIGVDIEAFRAARGELFRMNATVSTLLAHGNVARIYDLDVVSSSSDAFDTAFTDIFSFLGVDNVTSCVARAARYDLHRRPAHNSHPMASSLTNDRNNLRLALQDLSQERDFPMYRRHILPFRRDLQYDRPRPTSS